MDGKSNANGQAFDEELRRMAVNRTLVTGGAGFIGSHICDSLLKMGDEVVCIDDLSTGSMENIDHLSNNPKFRFADIDINDSDRLLEELDGVSRVSHQAAIGSVPRSVKDPSTTMRSNVMGTLSLLDCCKKADVKKVVFASSSSVYGDNQDLPKVETKTGKPLSPYALSKSIGENMMRLYSEIHGFDTICLRYFNVFGPRQSPDGPYAAVIPLFIQNAISGKQSKIFGDGLQSRDFSYVSNVADANVRALSLDEKTGQNLVMNIACGSKMTVSELHDSISRIIYEKDHSNKIIPPKMLPRREGDILHSLANIGHATTCLGYVPTVSVEEGLKMTVSHHFKTLGGP
jgi:UDP-N-acetylglucosamine 4-epimerase